MYRFSVGSIVCAYGHFMSNSKRLAAVLFVSCSLVLGGQVPASASQITSEATGELDQSAGFAGNNFSFGLSGTTELAQIFTAGISGELTSVGVGIAQNGSVTDLTIEISSLSAGLPSGAPLASTTLSGSGLSVITTGQQIFTVEFASPAQVEEGSIYAIVAGTTTPSSDGGFTWYDSIFYADGQAAIDNNGSGWALETSNPPRSLTFETYVIRASQSNAGSSESALAPPVLTLTLPQGVQCTSSTLTASGPWISLPSASDCSITPRDNGDDPSLLGWATRADFPVDIAQRQVDNGWGAYETYGADGRLTGVFVPAGGSAAVTGDTNLYPIWS